MEHLVEHYVIHPNYNPETVDNDVALLRISTSEDDDIFGDSIYGQAKSTTRKKRGRGGHRRGHQNKKNNPSIMSFSPACLPEQDEELPAADAHCTIIGWGKEKNSHVYGTDVLHEAEVIESFYLKKTPSNFLFSNLAAILNCFAFNYRSHETKIVLFCVHAKWILAH
jgi:hypothetical protein